MQTKFTTAINQICDEKNLSRDVVMETVKAALASAYKKDYGSRDQEVRVEIDEDTGEIQVYVIKEVVDTVEDEMTQMSIEKADRIKKGVKAGDTVEILDIPADFGRIAAQTAKQVIIQRIREAERDMVFEEFQDKEGELVNGVVQRVEGDTVIVDMGKATGVLYRSEQMAGEHYYTGQRIKVYVVKVESATRGPQIVLSRSHPDMIKKLFEMEVPEILAGTIEIKSIAREGGERTKIAVSTDQDSIDPVGALVGQRGSRVQSVMSEIGEEKIDIILWDPDMQTYITNALSPAKVIEVVLNEADKKATVKVPEDQLSLAIGKKGQNVRLAAKLTGWNVDIAGTDDAGIESTAQAAAPVETKKAVDLEDAIIKNIASQKEEKDAVKQKDAKEEEKPEEALKADSDLIPEIKKDERKTLDDGAEEAPNAGETVAGSDVIPEEVDEAPTFGGAGVPTPPEAGELRVGKEEAKAEKETSTETGELHIEKEPKAEEKKVDEPSIEDVLNEEEKEQGAK